MEIEQYADIHVRLVEFARYGESPNPRKFGRLENGLSELKVGIVRLPYFEADHGDGRGAFRLTHGFYKNDQTTPRHQINRALRIMRDDLGDT